MFTTLITPLELAAHLDDPNWIVVDCRFSLADTGRGRAAYEQAHVAGAIYAHLNDDLSSTVIPGVTGRHPLPAPEAAAAAFGRLGISPGMQVVAYDDMGGALAAARLWWMLRWLGHEAVAVLDGGWQRWLGENLPTRRSIETRPLQAFTAQMRPELMVNAAQVDAMRQDPAARLLDARTADRYRGENETIDPVAGHIPGAVSAPFIENLTSAGTFAPREQLQARYRALLGNIPAESVAVYCGSGVTAIHNLLAMKVAGLGDARLYPGSWSEWITNPERPTAAG
ncbi:MAG: sulfurtransferase [Chloroflexota bacterium]